MSEADLALALRLADVADAIALRDFSGGPLAFTEKPDGSPVTATDPEIEAALRAIVAEERPEDGFLGEEVGPTGSSRRRWIVDGIDGTIEYVAGRRGWSTEIALEEDGEVALGECTSPALPLPRGPAAAAVPSAVTGGSRHLAASPGRRPWPELGPAPSRRSTSSRARPGPRSSGGWTGASTWNRCATAP